MTTVQNISILVADDHAVVREGLKRLIDSEPDMEVTGEAASGNATIEAVEKLKPNVVVLDISLPELSGLQVTRRLKESFPDVRILILTIHEDTSYVRELLQAGASGYVLKRCAPNELISAIRIVVKGGIYIDPYVAGKLMDTLIASKGKTGHPFGELSERETEVLRLIAQGFSNREIANELAISIKTVETYKARSMEKLGLRSRADLVRAAAKRGWLHQENFES